MFEELRCPVCAGKLRMSARQLTCVSCRKTYPIQNSMAVLWQETDEKNKRILGDIIRELRISRDLSLGKLPSDGEFWARNSGTIYAAHMMDEKPYRTLLRMLPPLQTLSILNIGCGAGNEAEWLLSQGAKRVVCTDISINLMNLAIKRFAGKKRKPSYFVRANAENLPFLRDSFDLILYGTALHHIPRTDLTLRSASGIAPLIAAVNEPGDMLFFGSILEKAGWNTEYGGLKTHRFNVSRLRKLFQSVGFDAEIKSDFTWFPLKSLRMIANNKPLINMYYMGLSLLDLVLKPFGHNLTIVAKRKH